MSYGSPDTSIKTDADRQAQREARLDEALEESFPASDPVSINIETPDTCEPSRKNANDE